LKALIKQEAKRKGCHLQ